MGKKLTRKEINAMSCEEWVEALREAINEFKTCLIEELVKTKVDQREAQQENIKTEKRDEECRKTAKH